MRTLCLRLESPDTSLLKQAEIFLSLSPRIQTRGPNLIFIDIESTSRLLGGEGKILRSALSLAKRHGLTGTRAGLADRPPVAQLLSAVDETARISPPGEDLKTLAAFPLAALPELEGLTAWPEPRRIGHMIEFFSLLGIHWIGEIQGFPLSHFRERWGVSGVALWRRIHGREEEVISPLPYLEPFHAYGYFDDPIGELDRLMRGMAPTLHSLFSRLHDRGRFARRLELTLYCEYSEVRHCLFVEPVSPSRNETLFRDLLERKLDGMDLLNPIREFEIVLHDVPEKTLQMDFFEPRDRDQERWQRLISFAGQMGLRMGFLEPLPKHFPEEGFHLKADWPTLLSATDHVERQAEAIQVKSVYAKNLLQSPRPTLLCREPRRLSRQELRKFRKLTFFPAERIHSFWWKDSTEEGLSTARDYYFAVSAQGELVWIFQDRHSKDYFLHGYFD